MSTVQLEPAPIPLNVKVVLFGEHAIAELLQAYDNDFPRLFRVIADFGDDLPRSPAPQHALPGLLRVQAQHHGLLPPNPAALARPIDHGAREAGDARRINAGLQRLLDMPARADHLARAAGRAEVAAADITGVIAARRQRASRIDERLRDEAAHGMLMIANGTGARTRLWANPADR